MAVYSGKFQYRDEGGAALAEGACRLEFDSTNCTITPASGEPLVFDLGGVDRFSAANWEAQLALYTGRTIILRQFGAAFDGVVQELQDAWRGRLVHCMLLEDLEETGRLNGTASLGAEPGSPAEIRIYKSNIAVLPAAANPFQWRLADVDSISFDEAAYGIQVCSGPTRLAVAKLAKKTGECLAKLQEAFATLRAQAGVALRETFPFLDPDRLRNLLDVMPEGRSAPSAALAAIHPKLPDALIAQAVDSRLRPYFDALRQRSGSGEWLAGFKFIRPDAEKMPGDSVPEEAEETGGDTSAKEASGSPVPENPLFFWFFFPLEVASILAWEATTGGGRATYFFRVPAGAPMAEAAAALTRGLALVNFRREPIYLPDESLELQPRYCRYAVACRKLPDLRAVRSAMLGRAMHSSVEAWQIQVESILNRGRAVLQ